MISKILRYLMVAGNSAMMSNENEKATKTANESESFNLLLNKPEAHALKSGHCMKEDCGLCKALINVGESQSSIVLPIPAKDCRELKNDSNVSLGICRICHCNPETLPELGSLQSVCNCRGTVALVHMNCLERWLAESDSSSCELCRYQFNVERIPKHGLFESVLVWINEVADFNQILMDTIWFWLMTPLAAMAGYIFIRATSELIDDNFPTDAPWLMAALMLNSCLTLVAYYGWVMNSVKKHVSSWYRWWRTMDCIIKIQIPDRQLSSTISETEEIITLEETIEEEKASVEPVTEPKKKPSIKVSVQDRNLSFAPVISREKKKKTAEKPKKKSKIVGKVKSKLKTFPRVHNNL